MVVVAQLVRASVCGTEGRGFEPRLPPKRQKPRRNSGLFLWNKVKDKKALKQFKAFFISEIT
jgi:hypothetical protein